MSPSNAELSRRIIDAFSTGDLDVIDELVDPGCIEHQRGNQSGREGAKEVIRTLHRWMSDFSLTIEDQVVDGDMVWMRNRARGTNTGSIMGNPPSNSHVEVDVIDIGRFKNGKLVEHWGVADQLGLMLQVGALPGRREPSAGG